MTDSHNPPSPSPPARLTPEQVSLILQRAAEIDASGESMSAEELERIASEAGIDPRATRAAIMEVLAGQGVVGPARLTPITVAPRTVKPDPPSPRRIMLGGAVGVVVGFMASFSAQLFPFGLGVAALHVILRAVQAMRRGSQLDFQLQNSVLWLVTMLIMGTSFQAEGAGFAFFCWIVTSFAGGLLVRFGPREDAPEDEPPRIEASR